jgi:alpha,alpha-trehalase
MNDTRQDRVSGLDELCRPHVLREYSLLADGERGALVGPRGDIAWMCAPRWHSDGVFSALIGGVGCYAVTPADPRFVWGGYYENDSLIWRSRWITTAGVIECREALAYPGDAGTAVLLRQIMAVDAPARVRVSLDVRAGFGRHAMTQLERGPAGWSGRSGSLRWRWSGSEQAERQQDGSLVFLLELDKGQRHDLVLEITEDHHYGTPVHAAPAWEATQAAWSAEMPSLGGSLAPRDSLHSYAVLAGLTSGGGGMVAAATTSLPERAEAGRNYDYRYAWIRDQCYAGQAVAADGPHRLLDDAVRFVSARLLEDGPRLKPAYTVTGDPVPDEHTLSGLAGYPGGSDKVGNWVSKQFQLDALGESLLLLAAAARHDRLDTEHWRAAEAAASAIGERWQEPDAGVWELGARKWTHSRLICAAGLRAISAAGAVPSQAARWQALADTVLADVASSCVHPGGHWQRAADDSRVDAALLLAAIRGATTADDPRALETLRRVRSELAVDGYLYRFRHDQRPLNDAEGAFILCGFLMALALHQQGETAQAVAWFERNRAACGPPALLTEEFDVVQRQLRGNIPQAFVHALLFEAAARLSRPWDSR